MTAQISDSVGSYESGAVNHREDVKTVQRLLRAAATLLQNPAFDPGGVDGLIARDGSRSSTVKAISQFQRQRVGMTRPDDRIDVGGNTWQALVSVAPAKPIVAPGTITLTVTHGNQVPTKTVGKEATVTSQYESTFTLSGGLSGTFTGSIWPDDMNIKGRVVDGQYPLHIGFHKGGGAARQTASNLVVKTNGIRAALLVNARQPVPVMSNSTAKTTSVGINVHNGYYNPDRGSDGCLTLHPADWSRFMQLFLDAFPEIDSWHTVGTNTGQRVGQLIIRP